MALSASAAATLLDNYASVCLMRQTPEFGTVAAQGTADTNLASTRSSIVADIVASATLPAKTTATAGAMLDQYTNAYVATMLGLHNAIADGSNLTASLQSQRTTILSYLTA